jgi:tRNA pseudouridine-54 N-methylase
MMEQVAHLRFILHLPGLSEDGDFLFKDLPGSGKRIDVLCRSLAACFDWGPSTLDKSNLELVALIGEASCLRIKNPDTDVPRGEVWWGCAIKDALNGNPPPFITTENLSLEEVVEKILTNDKSRLWVLDEAGSSFDQREPPDMDAQNSFIIGDHRGFNSEALTVFADHSIYRLSLGSTSYLTSQCVAAVISMYEEMIHDVASR